MAYTLFSLHETTFFIKPHRTTIDIIDTPHAVMLARTSVQLQRCRATRRAPSLHGSTRLEDPESASALRPRSSSYNALKLFHPSQQRYCGRRGANRVQTVYRQSTAMMRSAMMKSNLYASVSTASSYVLVLVLMQLEPRSAQPPMLNSIWPQSNDDSLRLPNNDA